MKIWHINYINKNGNHSTLGKSNDWDEAERWVEMLRQKLKFDAWIADEKPNNEA